MSESEYVVESILNVRIRNGIKEYLLKWEGYEESESTWEPEWNLKCHDLVRKFEKSRRLANVTSRSRESGNSRNLSVMIIGDSPAVQNRKEVEKVLKMKIHNGKKKYLIKWKGHSESENTWEFGEKLECRDLIRFDQIWQDSSMAPPPKEDVIMGESSEKIAEKTPPAQSGEDAKITHNERTRRRRKISLVKFNPHLPPASTWEPEENIGRKDLLKNLQLKEKKSSSHISRPEPPKTAPTKNVVHQRVPVKQSVRDVERIVNESRKEASSSSRREKFSENSSTCKLEKRNRPFDLRTESSEAKRRKTNDSEASDEAELECNKEADKIMAIRHEEDSPKEPSLTIEGATELDGEFMFIIKWPGAAYPVLMSSKEASKKYPQVVIAFYEKNLTFRDPRKG